MQILRERAQALRDATKQRDQADYDRMNAAANDENWQWQASDEDFEAAKTGINALGAKLGYTPTHSLDRRGQLFTKYLSDIANSNLPTSLAVSSILARVPKSWLQNCATTFIGTAAAAGLPNPMTGQVPDPITRMGGATTAGGVTPEAGALSIALATPIPGAQPPYAAPAPAPVSPSGMTSEARLDLRSAIPGIDLYAIPATPQSGAAAYQAEANQPATPTPTPNLQAGEITLAGQTPAGQGVPSLLTAHPIGVSDQPLVTAKPITEKLSLEQMLGRVIEAGRVRVPTQAEAVKTYLDMYSYLTSHPDSATPAAIQDFHKMRIEAGFLPTGTPINMADYDFAARSVARTKQKADYVNHMADRIEHGALDTDAAIREWAISDWANDPFPLYGLRKSAAATASGAGVVTKTQQFYQGRAKTLFDELSAIYKDHTADPRYVAKLTADLSQANYLAVHPDTAPEDVPAVPQGYGARDALTEYQHEVLKDKAAAVAESKYRWTVGQNWKQKEYDLALDKFAASKAKGGPGGVRQMGQAEADALRMLGFGSNALDQAPQEALKLYGKLLRDGDVTKGGMVKDANTGDSKYVAPQLTQTGADAINALTDKYNTATPPPVYAVPKASTPAASSVVKHHVVKTRTVAGSATPPRAAPTTTKKADTVDAFRALKKKRGLG